MKRMSVKVSLFVGALLLTFATVAPVNAFQAGEGDCSDGIPRRNCKIWDVEYEEGPNPGSAGTVTCNTGGEWQCFVGPDNEELQ